MPTFGYKLMSEEHGPEALVRNAGRAEAAGFDFVAISDHVSPWLDSQGHSPYAWSVLGAIAARTERIGITTAVTCPTMRYHPVVVAQAAATVALLSRGRFSLGLGSGENLNEHVVGRAWPAPRVRQAMLNEAIDVIRLLFEGKEVSFDGQHVAVDRAKLWDLPAQPPTLLVAAGGPNAAQLAAEKNAGLFATEPRPELTRAYAQAGGQGPRYAEVPLCWAPSEQEAARTAHERFRFGVPGWSVMTDLATPKAFEAATQTVRLDDVQKQVACGPDPERHITAVREFVSAGFTHLTLVGVGPDQEGFLRFWQDELAPRLRKL
jgi:G6PDH family F420-dependent oxidoreductase